MRKKIKYEDLDEIMKSGHKAILDLCYSDIFAEYAPADRYVAEIMAFAASVKDGARPNMVIRAFRYRGDYLIQADREDEVVNPNLELLAEFHALKGGYPMYGIDDWAQVCDAQEISLLGTGYFGWGNTAKDIEVRELAHDASVALLILKHYEKMGEKLSKEGYTYSKKGEVETR